MQFKNIGEFLKLAKKTTGITELSNLAKSIGNVNDVASALKNISNLSDDLKVGILSSMDGVNAEMARTVLGIKQVGDASTTATSSVTGLGSAIVGAFKTHPILMVVTAITAVVGAIYGVSNAIEKARFEKAQELTTAFDEAKTGIDDYKQKITELNESLASGTLSESEAYEAKSQLFDIQQQLISQYGASASGIDLVNGSLQTQIDLINQLSKDKAEDYLQDIDREYDIDKVTSAMEDTKSYYLGQVSDGYRDILEPILNKYGIELDDKYYSGGAYNIYFEGDVTDAKEKLTDLRSEIQKIEDEGTRQALEFDLYGIDDNLDDIDTVIEKYQDIYDSIKAAQLIAKEDLISTPYDKETPTKTAYDLYTDYANAIQDFNQAVLGTDETTTTKAKEYLSNVRSVVDEFLSDTENIGYTSLFDTLTAGLNTSAEAALNFSDALKSSSLQNYLKRLSSFKKEDLQLISFDDTKTSTQENALKNIMQVAVDNGVIDEVSTTNIPVVLDLLVKDGWVEEVQEDVQNTASATPVFSSIFSSEEITKQVDDFQSNIASIQDALDKLKSGEYTSTDIIDLIQQFPQLASETDNLSEALNNLAVDNFISTMDSIKKSMGDVTTPSQFAALKYFSDELKKQLISSFNMSDITSDDLLNRFKEITSFDNWDPSGFQENFGKLINEFSGTKEGKAALLALSADIELNPELAYEDYETLKSYVEENKLLADIEFSDDRMEELQSKMTALQDESTKLQDSLSFKEAKGIKPLVSDYRSLIDNSNSQIKNLQKQNEELRVQQNELRKLGLDETSAGYQEIESQINANVSAINQARLSQLEWNNSIDNLRYEPNEGLTAYNTAKNTRNAGDNYLDMLAAAKEAQEAYNKGLVGTDDFKTAAAMFSPNAMDDAANWKENYGNITRYFTEDVSGVKNFLNDLSKETNECGEALATCNEATGTWSYSIDDVQASADALGISFEAFLAIMGRLQDYGFTNDFFSSVEEGQDHISDLYVDLYEAETKLNELKQAQKDGDETVTDTVLSAQEARINQIKQSILESQNLLDQLVAKDANSYEQEYAGKMSSLVQRLSQADDIDDEGARKSYINKIKDWAESESIDISDLFTFDGDINKEVLDSLAEDYKVDLTFSTEYAEKAADELGKTITSAMEDADSEIKPLVDSLAQYTNEQFSSITFGDGSYEKGVLGDAERTIDQLLTSLGLGQEQAQMLLQILGELGYIELTTEVNTKGTTEETQTAISEAQSTADSNPVIVPMKMAPEGRVPSIEETAGQVFSLDILGNNEPAKESVTEAKQFGDSQDATISVDADTSPALNEVNTLVASINHRTATLNVNANTQGITSAIDSALSGTRTINLRAQVIGGLPGYIGPANGTAHAHVNGTAYSMWTSYRHSVGAYANGTSQSWGLKNNETALVNELGFESRVRNGQWELIPGGAHFESFKKGDIIFNHKQTAELLKYGHVVSDGGRGRIAHADGTAYNVMRAYSNGAENTGVFQGGASSSSNNTKAINNNTSAVKAATTTAKKTSSKSMKSLEDFQKWLDKLKDWIEVRIQRLQENIELYTSKADNATGYVAKNNNIDTALTSSRKLETVNASAITKYNEQLNEIVEAAVAAKLVNGSNVSKRTERANNIITKIKNGSININEYGENEREFISSYSEW